MKITLTRFNLLITSALLIIANSTYAQTGSPHECDFCHVTHNAPGPQLRVNTDVEVICLTCHGPAGVSTKKANVHTNSSGKYSVFSMTCIDCHAHHSSLGNWLTGTNIKQIGRDLDGTKIARINTPNSGVKEVVYESTGSDNAQPTLHSFADNDEDNNGVYDGVCEVCHTLTDHHRNNIPDQAPGHNSGRSCTICHPHDSGFAPAGGPCDSCHNTVQDNGDNVPPGGRRAVVGEFALFSHHLQNTLDVADCEVCQDHQRRSQWPIHPSRSTPVERFAFAHCSADSKGSSHQPHKLRKNVRLPETQVHVVPTDPGLRVDG